MSAARGASRPYATPHPSGDRAADRAGPAGAVAEALGKDRETPPPSLGNRLPNPAVAQP